MQVALWGGCSSWLIDNGLLPVSSHGISCACMQRTTVISLSSFCPFLQGHSLVLSDKGPTLWPHRLLLPPGRPCLPIQSCWRLKLWIPWGDSIQPISKPPAFLKAQKLWIHPSITLLLLAITTSRLLLVLQFKAQYKIKCTLNSHPYVYLKVSNSSKQDLISLLQRNLTLKIQVGQHCHLLEFCPSSIVGLYSWSLTILTCCYDYFSDRCKNAWFCF